MSCASTRISLQWPPAEPSEPTSTLVLVSPQSHFVDIRINKDSSLPPLDWIITGKENVVATEPVLKIEFQHEINTHVPGNTGGEFDIGDFTDIEGSTDRLESGVMMNLETEQVQAYNEVWRSIDSLKSTEDEFVLAEKDAPEPPCTVLKVRPGQEFKGTLVRLGNWMQAAVLNREGEVSCVRLFKGTDGWKVVFELGNDVGRIPIDGEGEKLEMRGLQWVLVEKSG